MSDVALNAEAAERLHHAREDRPTWRRLVLEKAERIRAFEAHVLPRLLPCLKPGARVLEIGCGLGWATCVMYDRAPWASYTATDLLPDYLLGHSRHVARFFEAQVGFVATDAAWLPFAARTFDLIYSQMVLYRLPADDLSFTLEDGWRVLRPGGVWVALERAAPRWEPWRKREQRHLRARNARTGLAERALTRAEWLRRFKILGAAPRRVEWATGPAWCRRLTNLVRTEHALFIVEKP